MSKFEWQDRLDEAINRHIERMTLETMEEVIRADLSAYFWSEADEDEIYEFIEANEESNND